MSYERRRETPILWCWLSIEADPSVLILGGVRRVISRRVEAVLIGHARHPSNRVAVETLLRLWYSERGRRDWGPRCPVLQGESSWTYTQEACGLYPPHFIDRKARNIAPDLPELVRTQPTENPIGKKQFLSRWSSTVYSCS